MDHRFGTIVQIDDCTQACGIGKFSCRRFVGGEHDLIAPKAHGFSEHEFAFAGAVHAAALVL